MKRKSIIMNASGMFLYENGKMTKIDAIPASFFERH